jgi:hypothetical protein
MVVPHGSFVTPIELSPRARIKPLFCELPRKRWVSTHPPGDARRGATATLLRKYMKLTSMARMAH